MSFKSCYLISFYFLLSCNNNNNINCEKEIKNEYVKNKVQYIESLVDSYIVICNKIIELADNGYSKDSLIDLHSTTLKRLHYNHVDTVNTVLDKFQTGEIDTASYLCFINFFQAKGKEAEEAARQLGL